MDSFQGIVNDLAQTIVSDEDDGFIVPPVQKTVARYRPYVYNLENLELEDDFNFVELTSEYKTVNGTHNKYRVYWHVIHLERLNEEKRDHLSMWVKMWDSSLEQWTHIGSNIRAISEDFYYDHDPLRATDASIQVVNCWYFSSEGTKSKKHIFWVRAGDLLTFTSFSWE